MRDYQTFGEIFPGQLFLWQNYRFRFRRRVGVGQILSADPEMLMVHVKVLLERGEQLETLIGYLPITFSALQASAPKLIRRLPPSADWEPFYQQWLEIHRAGKAGAFSVPLRETVAKILETVKNFTEFDPDQKPHIAYAYPIKDDTGNFTTIRAEVVQAERQATSRPWGRTPSPTTTGRG